MTQDEFLNLPPNPRVSCFTWTLIAVVALVFLALLLPGGHVHLPAKIVMARLYVDQLVAALQSYKTEYGVFPHGSSADIFRILHGDNPRKIVYFEAVPKQFDAAGRLLDPWKMPYRIDTSDPEHPRVYSFGPNLRDDDCSTGSDDVGPTH